MIKKLDIIIIVILILISFLPQLFYTTFAKSDTQNTYALITLDGNKYKEIPLSSHVGTDEFIIRSTHGFNKIRIIKDSIEIMDADCKNELCVKQGKISRPGQTIACLPHKLLIEIKGTSKHKQTIIPVG